MTTTDLIELLKKHERGGATGHPREVMLEVDGRIIDTDGIEVTGSGDGLISELYLSLPAAQSEIIRCKDCKHSEPWYKDRRRCFLWAEDGIDIFDDGFCNYAER